MALTGQDRDDVIRGLRAKGWSLRIGKHPDVQLSAAMVHEILKAGLPLSAVNGMAAAAAAAAAGDDDDVESNGEPDALDGLSDVLRAELLTLTSSGSVRLAHWRARRHDVSAELYAWLNREYARLGPYRRGREGEREQHALTRRAALPLRSAD